MSQKRLGQLINYSTIAIRKLESNDRQCSEALAESLASALQVPGRQRLAFILSARTGIMERSLQTLGAVDPVASAQVAGADASTLAQLVTFTTQIFGRESEIAWVLELLQRPARRLITLIGPPGVGKTRLGLEVMRQADPLHWPDGKFFVPLADIDHVSLIPDAIAASMDIRSIDTRKWRDTRPSQNVFKFLKDKQVLLVLDNFEHLLDGIPFLTALLASAPFIKLMLTSRASLYLSGEQEYPVMPLETPARTTQPIQSWVDMTQNPAVRLFVARAQSRQPSFRLTERNASAVVELCQILDGLPLAIELAAVRLRVQSPAELLAEFKAPSARAPLKVTRPSKAIDPSPMTTLQWLDKATKDTHPRHQTLTAALAWSYNLLIPQAQLMFEQLSVFHGGFTREAALEVTQGTLDSLELLASHSLVQVKFTTHESARLSLLEVFREFASTKLEARGEVSATKHRHAQYFLALLQRLADNQPRPDEMDAVDIVSIEIANMRAALSWCLTHDLSIGVSLARYMNYYWVVNGDYHEGRAWTLQLLQASEHDDAVPPEARAYLWCVGVLLHTGTPLAVVEQQLEVFRRLNIKEGMATAEGILGWMHLRNAPMRAERHLGAAVAVLEANGQHITWLSATLRMFRALALYTMGEFTTSQRLLDEAIQIHTDLRDERSVARTQNSLAWLRLLQGRYDESLEVVQQVLLLNQRFKEAYSLGRAFVTKAMAEVELGRLTQAHASVAEGMRVVEESGVGTLQAFLLHVAGSLAFAEGNAIAAGKGYLQSIALAQPLGLMDCLLLNLINMAQMALKVDNIDNINVSPIVQWLSVVQTDAKRMAYYLPPPYQIRLDQLMKRAQAQLDKVHMDTAVAKGSEMPLDAAIALAQAVINEVIAEP